MAISKEDAALISQEFPDFDIASLPDDIPDWLTCNAWHNDTCPLWYDAAGLEGEGEGIFLAIDYPDPERREFPEASRFSVNVISNCSIPAVVTDDWSDVLEVLERFKPAEE